MTLLAAALTVPAEPRTDTGVTCEWAFVKVHRRDTPALIEGRQP